MRLIQINQSILGEIYWTFYTDTSVEPMSFSKFAATILEAKFGSFSVAELVSETRFADMKIF